MSDPAGPTPGGRGTQLRIAPMDADEVVDNLDRIAALRLRIFADYPYLYEGDAAFEAGYLRPYLEAPGAIVVAVWDGAELVGAATGTPLEGHHPAFAAAFAMLEVPASEVFYCAESVLLPAYRGRGIGHTFFDRREAHARALGHRWSAFCSVVRPEDHPARPADYHDLEGFWTRRGYAKLPGVIARFRWRDRFEADESEKPLQFWIRRLREDAP